MKVLHIVAGDIGGGAARGAYWLHQGLISLGVDSKLLSNSGTIIDDKSIIYVDNTVIGKIKKKLKSRWDRFFCKFYPNRTNGLFSCGLGGYDFLSLKEYKDADIIHLHWINDGFISIEDLGAITKPIVWTIRDMWPFTGGCHYSMGCDFYIKGCGNCPQLNSHFKYDLSYYVYRKKLKYFGDQVHFVGISKWISEQAQLSLLCKDNCVTTINNCVDFSAFQPFKKSESRRTLGIDTPKKILLVGAKNVNSNYKGFDVFLESLQYLSSEKYFVCLFGQFDESVFEHLKFEYHSFGNVSDTKTLSRIYSCSDVFIAPSKYEAFGKTIVESMYCKTPVVCFNATGPKDIIEHKVTGYKAKPYQAKDLAAGISWIVNNSNHKALCEDAHNSVKVEYSKEQSADTYLSLYERIN